MAAIDNLRVLADWDRDVTWDHPLADITGRVLAAQWSYGFNAPGQLIAPPATGTVLLDNADGAFTLGKAGATFAGLLRRGVMIQFQHIVGTTLSGFQITPWPITVLRVTDIAITTGALGDRTVTLTLGDWHDELMNALYDPPLTLNTTTGVAAAAPFSEGLVPLAYPGQYWILDVSVLDVDTVPFAAGNAYGSFYLGSTTLDYVGDNVDRGSGTSLYAFIEEMCVAEMTGRFWMDTWEGVAGFSPRPRWRYMGRTDMATRYDAASIFTIPSSRVRDTGNEYEYSRMLCNSLEITMYPRTAGSAGSELARTASPIRLQPRETRQITLRYRDPLYPDGTCSATTIITPVATTDYTANTAQDGSGTNVTSSLGVGVENRTSAAYVNLTNNSAADLYVTLFKIRGTPLTARQPVTVKSINAQSIHDYGYHRKAWTIAGVDDQDLVQRYADYYVDLYNLPIARYRTMTFDWPADPSDPMYRPALILPLFFAGLKIVDDFIEDTANTRIHWVAGEQHTVGDGQWTTTWFLEDYVQSAFWVLDDPDLSVLDISTRPAF